MKQNTQEWLDFRRSKIGASDAAAIMGVSPWQTRYQKWEEKVYGKDQEQNGAMARGTRYEEEARAAFEKMTGISVMPKVIVSSERDWMMASLDGVSFDGTIFTEIKVPNEEAHELAKRGVIADFYNIQMQHQYESDKKFQQGFYFSYFPRTKEGVVVEVKKDELFIEEMLEEEEKFMELIRSGTPPELCDRDYERHDDERWIGLSKEINELKSYRKSIQEREDTKMEELKKISNHRNAMGGGFRLTRIPTKGRVDYDQIPELMGVDIERYRKPASERWTLATCK